MSAITTRPRGYAEWNPRKETRDLLDAVKDVLQEYVDYWPLTIRQLFYRLVGAHDYPKTESAYERLCNHVGRARRAGLLDWDAIRDDRATIEEPWGYMHPQHYVQRLTKMLDASNYARNPRDFQPTGLLVACEAAGMLPMIQGFVSMYGATVMSSGGFDSVTVKRNIALRAGARPLVVLHIGDHDPSGVHLFSSFAEDVGAFARAHYGAVEFHRIAVLPEHIETYSLPTAPAKRTDRRSFEGETVQAEALPPEVLRQIVVDAAEAHTDMDVLASLRARVKAEREELTARLADARIALLRGDHA